MDFYTSCQLDATPLDAIEPFMEELGVIVKEMQERLPMETKILEGTDIPTRGDIIIPPPVDLEAILAVISGKNELSQGETKEDQWINDSLNGCSITGPTRGFTVELNNSAFTAELFNQNCPIRRSNATQSPVSISSCEEMPDACGCATGVTNEPCACMEQTISVPMAGTQSEEK